MTVWTRLLTVTLTRADVVARPAASRARAERVWAPFPALVEVQLTEYGADVSGLPRFTPSSRNCTEVTPTSSDASAVTVTVPDTVLPPAGAVTATEGGAVSETVVVKIASPDTAEFPAASVDRTR